jgi:hypothetical protein
MSVRPTRTPRALIAAAILATLAGPAAVATRAAPAPRGPTINAPGASPEEKARIGTLRAAAVGDDRFAARKAFDDLKAAGPAARPTLTDALRLVLTRDRDLLDQNVRKCSTTNLAALEADAAAQRKAALEKVGQLSGAGAEAARPLRPAYDKLKLVSAKLDDAYAARSLLIDASRFRPDLAAMWKEVATAAGTVAGPAAVDPAQEAKLASAVREALSDKLYPILEDLRKRPTENVDPPAKLPEQAGLLAYRLRKRVDAYNRGQAAAVDPHEMELARLVNAYRDALGLQPLEVDPRLTQAARRHTKEMVDLKYFSPTSPTEATRTRSPGSRRPGTSPTGRGPRRSAAAPGRRPRRSGACSTPRRTTRCWPSRSCPQSGSVGGTRTGRSIWPPARGCQPPPRRTGRPPRCGATSSRRNNRPPARSPAAAGPAAAGTTAARPTPRRSAPGSPAAARRACRAFQVLAGSETWSGADDERGCQSNSASTRALAVAPPLAASQANRASGAHGTYRIRISSRCHKHGPSGPGIPY